MKSWAEVLDFWERKVQSAEQALDNHLDWSNIDTQPFVMPDGLGKPSIDLLPRYENLNQRTQAIEQRMAEEGSKILAELETIVSFRSHRYETPAEPSRVDSRV